MAWRIEIKGTAKEIADAVKLATDTEGKKSAQLESVRDAIASEIAAYPKKFSRFEVRAAGDEAPTQRNISITVNALNAE